MQDSREQEVNVSHVDEGMLHAYLDGELPAPERAALEIHIAQCATCSARLADERSLIERASAVLRAARPSERPAPPLSELTSRRQRGRRIFGARLPFAWAATVLLALGIGYYLHAPESPVPPAPEPQTVATTPDHPATTSVPASKKPEARQLQRRANAPRASSREEAATADKPRATDSTIAFVTQPLATGAVAAQSSNQLRGAAAPSALRVDEAIVRADSSLAGLRGRLVSSEWTIISRGSARTLLGADPVGIPGLAARDIKRSPTDAATIVVEQQLDSRTVIQLFQRPANVGGVEREFAMRSNELARYVGRLRVEITGPLTPDSLNRLLEQVQPLP